MKTIASIMATVAITAFAAGTALADCPETTGSVSSETGIAKDGTHAPLETEAHKNTKPADSDTAAKDGETMPLANQQGGGDKNLAMSQQDAEAQQQGDKTALAQAEECKDKVQ